MSDRVQITISRAAYDVLKRWASVGRTFDSACRLLDEASCEPAEPLNEVDREQALYTADELRDLKQALDECNSACKSMYHTEEAKNEDFKG